jgi:hypothetical protein
MGLEWSSMNTVIFNIKNPTFISFVNKVSNRWRTQSEVLRSPGTRALIVLMGVPRPVLHRGAWYAVALALALGPMAPQEAPPEDGQRFDYPTPNREDPSVNGQWRRSLGWSRRLDGKKWTHRQFGAAGELGFGIILYLV